MSNPFSHTVMECSKAQGFMASVWCGGTTGDEMNVVSFMLQEWDAGKRVLELSTNIRSGNDTWWNEVLDQCREGNLSQDNYDWMHGYPCLLYTSDAADE